MTRSLVQAILEAHRDDPRDGAVPWRVRPDHVVLDQSEGTFALWALRDTSARVRAGFGLMALDARGVHAGESPTDDSDPLKAAALELGLHVALAGLGHAAQVYVERHAAPGRLALGCAPDLARAGALGMLAWPASRLETAAALAGVPHALTPPEILGVRVVGAPGLGVGAHDLGVELARRLPAPRAARVIEMGGPGIERLVMRDRFALAADADALGCVAVVFPSDDRTHRWLAAQGRDADWKRSPADADDGAALELELEAIEPWLLRPGEPDSFRRVRHAAGTPVRRVIIGPRASGGDWAMLAARLEGRAVDPRVACIVVPGSRRIVETARASGVLGTLIAAGVRVTHGAGDAGPALHAEGATLQCATEDGLEIGANDTTWRASIESCAAAALTGAITDPREVVAEFGETPEPAIETLDSERIVAPVAQAEPAARPSERLPRRGIVLLRLGDFVGTTRMLPLGPRLHGLSPEELAELTFSAVTRDFAARARAVEAGWLVAGRGFLGGPRPDLAAWMLHRLGLRVVIARGYAEGAATALVHAGILPLVSTERDDHTLAAGDELELPSGLETLERGVPVTVRDLTRGSQLLLSHPLDDHEVRVVKHGGLLGVARAA